jgi:hypothetical protein
VIRCHKTLKNLAWGEGTALLTNAEKAHVSWYCLMDGSLHMKETSNAGIHLSTLPPMLVTRKILNTPAHPTDKQSVRISSRSQLVWNFIFARRVTVSVAPYKPPITAAQLNIHLPPVFGVYWFRLRSSISYCYVAVYLIEAVRRFATKACCSEAAASCSAPAE